MTQYNGMKRGYRCLNKVSIMKTIKTVLVSFNEIAEGEYIPEKMQPGVIYYAPHFKVSNHLCLCGCGHPAPLPIGPGHWNLTAGEKGVTLTPSIQQRFACKSHYIITEGKANFV